jgi:tRNA C32,U32 (ribose-2'-O)-methylase TrmJ
MVLQSISEMDEPDARVMYRNLRNLVERAAVQQAEIDRQFPLRTKSYNPKMASSWSKGHNPPNP